MRMLGSFLILALLCGSSYTNVVNDEVFTENGHPFAYPLEEDLAEQLVEGQDLNPAYPENGRISGPEYGGDVDEEKSPWNRDFPDDPDSRKPSELENEKQEKPPSIRKREGEEEFATFVDPAHSKRLNSEKQYFHDGGFEKRARVENLKASDGDIGDTLFIAVTTVCTAAAVFGLVAAAFVWRRVHKKHRAAQESEYPHYGVTGPAKERSGSASPVAAMDAKLASSAQLYHYQHTKQQIIAMEQSACEGKGQDSEDSEGEEDEGDFSVYEYPGLAPTGDIEVTNPLFENVASPQTKTDPKLAQLQPRLHQRYQGKSEDQ